MHYRYRGGGVLEQPASRRRGTSAYPDAVATVQTCLTDLSDRAPGRNSHIKRLRLAQIRLLAKALLALHRVRVGKTTADHLIRRSLPRPLFDRAMGYNRLFASLAEANAVAAAYIPAAHDHIDNARTHLGFADGSRPSDYPVLFHMRRALAQCRSLLDFGGNVGNVYYCYSRYLDFPEDFVWTVFDIAEMLAIGRDYARRREERRLRFEDCLDRIEPPEILLASGSLHYFEQPLPDLLAERGWRPPHVFINRTPLTTGPSIVTMQDARTYLAPSRLFNRDELISGMVRLGYELRDAWSVPELSFRVPYCPERSIESYSGLYFSASD